MKLIFFILLGLILASQTAHADIVGGAADAVSSGISSAIRSIADELFSLGVYIAPDGSHVASPTNSSVTNLLYNLGSFSPYPYNFDAVLDMQTKMDKLVFVPVCKIFVTIVAICVLIDFFFPMLSVRIYELTEFHTSSAVSRYIVAIMLLVLIMIGSTPLIWYILAFNDALTKEVFLLALPSFNPHVGGVVQYFCMAVAYFVLAIFYAWRILVIFIVSIMIRIILLLFILPRTREFGEKVMVYFVQVVFFQFIMMCYFTVGVSVTSLFSVFPWLQVLLFLALIIGGVILGFKLIFKISLFNVGKAATKVAVLRGL